MNRINLLPLEYRRVESTPRARMMALGIGVGVITFLLLWNLQVIVFTIPTMRQQLETTKSDVENKAKEVKRKYDPINQALTVLDNRQKTIAAITAQRDQLLWSVKLNQLCELVQPHKVWIRALELGKKSGGKGQEVKTLRLRCTAADVQTRETLVSNFRRTLRGDPGTPNPALGQLFYRDFTDMETPSLLPKTLKEGDSNIQERETIEFEVNLTFKIPEKSDKPAAGTAARK